MMTPTVHYVYRSRHGEQRIYCQHFGSDLAGTRERSEVTCARCLGGFPGHSDREKARIVQANREARRLKLLAENADKQRNHERTHYG